MHICVAVCACVCMQKERRMSGVLLYRSPCYSLETGSLTEPGVRLAEPSEPPVSLPTQ